MLKTFKRYIHERNKTIAMQKFVDNYGGETEFCERKLIYVTENMFKIFDPGTNNSMYFTHTLLGPVI